MRKTLIGLCTIALLAMALSPTLYAQGKSSLWRVSSGDRSVFLIGSIHYLKKSSNPISPAMEQAFQRSKKLVLEIDLQSVTPARAQAVTLEKGLYQDGTDLQKNLRPETYALVERSSKDLGLDAQTLNPLKPWVVAFTLVALKLNKLGFDPDFGVDRYLADRAQEAGKPVMGLETLEFQIDLIDQLSPRDQESMLLQTLKEMDSLNSMLDRLIAAWSTGDVATLEGLLHAGKQEFPELHEKLIAARNRRWLPQIEKLIKEGDSSLVVVGAAHLVGKDGVIELLKQRGYTVEQL